jgi:hypothetical protein
MQSACYTSLKGRVVPAIFHSGEVVLTWIYVPKLCEDFKRHRGGKRGKLLGFAGKAAKLREDIEAWAFVCEAQALRQRKGT